MVDPNTRQGKRTPVTLKIKFKSETLEQFIERYAVDVSQGGIFIRTKEPLSVGTQMKFEFQLRDASPLIAGEGTVVWTRENDPSRPAIAPGMGVRFDRLADGSQAILERILAEKAKQAPQRPAVDTMKPPLFTDTPTRVAPTPMQEALLGDNGRARRVSDDPGGHGGDSHTPLPKPMPFHSDADEFPDEAFEEATKVRALDELIAQTADASPAAEVTASHRNGRGEINERAETLTEPAEASMARRERTSGQSGRVPAIVARPDGAKPQAEIYEAPDLPNPPETASRPQAKLLDTSPSPRLEPGQPAFLPESLARTRLGVEPARGRTSSAPPVMISNDAAPQLSMEAPPLSPSSQPPQLLPSSSGMRAVAAEHTQPARMPPMQGRSNAPIYVLVALIIAVGAAAVWFLVLRPKAVEDANNANSQPPAATAPAPGSAAAPTPGSAAPTAVATPGSAAAPTAATPADLADTVIASAIDGARVEVSDTEQAGPAPFTAKLEKGKTYKVRVSAKGYATSEIEVKGGDDKATAKLVAKPRVISVTSDPAGALILVDGTATGKTTPSDVELSTSQGAKKSVKVTLRKSGFKPLDRTVEIAKLAEDDTRMSVTLDEKLTPGAASTPRPANPGTPRPPAGSDGDTTAQPPADSPAQPAGSDTSAPAPAPPPPAPAPSGDSSGSSAEPQPEFKPQPQ